MQARTEGGAGRYSVLVWVGVLFLVLNTLIRVAIIFFDKGWANLPLSRVAPVFGVGLVHDAVVLSYALVPFALLALMFSASQRGRRWFGKAALLALFALCLVMAFTGVSEFVFWNEFSNRFNFIAVDYLLFTREVIGNIKESYSMPLIFGGLLLTAAILFWFVFNPVAAAARGSAPFWPKRLALFFVFLALPVFSFFTVSDDLRDSLASNTEKEYAGNGYYEFFRAFRNNNLDYAAFYKTLPANEAAVQLQNALRKSGALLGFIDSATPVSRTIQTSGQPKPYNVVMVSMESLGSDYVEFFNSRFSKDQYPALTRQKGLTPNLDRLAQEGLSFGNVYATGLRTVRGLEALTLSIPPTPGHAVPMRKNNSGFQTFGGVMQSKGYEPIYVYGGYSYFDNMQSFFGRNGYTVIDRSAIAKEQISHETVWGVADEDLFKLAIREIDARVNAGKKVFAHVMTTSNHRPFTYPSGRIDIASGTSRAGAVKYSDWAIGELIKEAKTKPWFSNTIFVLVADHTSHGRGKSALPPEHYRIPMIVYAPGIVKPAFIDTMASQIDVAPTVLALLNQSYQSNFYGQDILTDGKLNERAFLSNYLTVGYYQGERVVELGPKRKVSVVNAQTGAPIELDSQAQEMIATTVGYYQTAAELLIKQGK